MSERPPRPLSIGKSNKDALDVGAEGRATGLSVVGNDRVRLLRDGVIAHAAMLGAIAGAEREVLLEMYWIGADSVGDAFLGALVERAEAGIVVRVVYDAFGSISLRRGFWEPLLAAGGEVSAFSPLAPWQRRFRLRRLLFRDHRKNLVVDHEHGFAGGINLGAEWAPLVGMGWRDDSIELWGPAAGGLRTAFYETWTQMNRTLPADSNDSRRQPDARVRVVTNEFAGHPNRAIRRTYLHWIHHAKESICIASAYFLPGPLFLRALRNAAKRGVRVRVLVPDVSDVLLAKLAMGSLLGRLLEDGVEVYAYAGRVMHAKTAVFDDGMAMIGSHNLDALSLRFNLECNVVVEDAAFAITVRKSFDADCEQSRRVLLADWRMRTRFTRFVAWVVALFRAFL